MKPQYCPIWVPALVIAIAILFATSPADAHRLRDSKSHAPRAHCAFEGRAGVGLRMRGPATDRQIMVLRDLIALECLYRRDGKSDRIEAMYRDVLAKSSHPLLRTVAYRRLARIAYRGGEHAAAEEWLQRSLQEKLK